MGDDFSLDSIQFQPANERYLLHWVTADTPLLISHVHRYLFQIKDSLHEEIRREIISTYTLNWKGCLTAHK